MKIDHEKKDLTFADRCLAYQLTRSPAKYLTSYPHPSKSVGVGPSSISWAISSTVLFVVVIMIGVVVSIARGHLDVIDHQADHRGLDAL